MVCLSAATASPARTVELSEMLFGMWNRLGLRNHVLDEGPDHHMRRGNFDAKKVICTGNERARSTILQQQHPSFRGTLAQAYFSCSRLCDKIGVHIL